MDVLGAIELRGATRPNAICTQGLDGLLLDLVIRVEVVEIVRCQIDGRPSIR